MNLSTHRGSHEAQSSSMVTRSYMCADGDEIPLTRHDSVYKDVSMRVAVTQFFRRWGEFKGRSGRAEFWLPTSAMILVMIAVMSAGPMLTYDVESSVFVESTSSSGIYFIAAIIALVATVPGWSLTWRRLHDAGFAGPWMFISIIPIIGWITILVMLSLPSRPQKMKREWEDPFVLGRYARVEHQPVGTAMRGDDE